DDRCQARDGADCRRRLGDLDDAERIGRETAWQGGPSRHDSRHAEQLQRVSAPVIGPTPLLDFFKRGDVARDVRMEAAQGALAPRAYEQIAILALLVEDSDREIRDVAEETLSRIPHETLAAFLGRPDTPLELREFFGDRGIFPDEIQPVIV